MWWLLAGAIVTEVMATLSLRASEGGRKKWWLVPVVAGYGAAFTLLALTLSAGMAVGVAYGVWAASGVALTAIAGRYLFREPLTWVMGAGIALIIGGVLLIEIGA
ncbi:QacE family quaternary ammonium compound efflux SMR transporter [Rhodococcus sp. 15-649-1-2]|uniref:DMT family transporter n=1 Tax=Nocardiaceae TaxID=85025 RepID=UPI00037C910D|nr:MULTISPECIES: multidrug efflux SMR transporter [Rhodococcus]OZD15195.1 QacE family quaternary ammonium compound efflux SMR transporter [Rhodococcus sp. 06-156-4C]OZD19717.1 QacE family quaternary ammonium compound efflux SMR transporter [Rhodococcus sp. 06-156-4a]OZD22972.1 QacE family quaternary ammonium compound efflux SMR transporter [Rhodococcus sp. 06-156-3C]OZD25736.1 QacE family quaternary ammonium compound efflux SMR transporter [Rhodococcus sp. 06-156-3b]OZD37943.1 QacE family quat